MYKDIVKIAKIVIAKQFSEWIDQNNQVMKYYDLDKQNYFNNLIKKYINNEV